MIIIAVSVSIAQTTSSVIFRVDMGPAAARGLLDVSVGNVYLSGTMNGWNATSIPMTRDNSFTDTVYTVTLTDMIVDSVYEYKFLGGSNWELIGDNDANHRLYKVKANANDNILPVVFFSDDSSYSNPLKPIKVTFKCNMEFEIAKGFFVPGEDVLNVRGGFNGWVGDLNIMKKPITGYIYTADTTLMMTVGNEQGYKFAYTHQGNTTWETDDQVFGLNETDYEAGTILVDRYFDDGDKNNSQTGFDLYFQVDCNNAKASFSSGTKDFPNGIKNVIVCGSQRPLIWPALGWPDSTLSYLIHLNDDGNDGDLVQGDKIYTAKATFPQYASLKFQYKYGINYALPEDNAGGNDNEAFEGGNHIINIGSSTATVIRTRDVFGVTGDVIITGVNETPQLAEKYSLEQNYPNPFNPSTTIKYSVPEAGLVTIKVYNMLGQEVATLVNEVKSASVNTVSFNAAGLSSGLYIYQINAKNFSASKKMMLLK